MIHQSTFVVETAGRQTVNITDRVDSVVGASGCQRGLCSVFVHHTSASLFINENADPDVRGDLERFFARLVRDGDAIFRHRDEGPDDMSAHVRSVLTATSMTIPVSGGRCDLGTWQGLYLWEHRTAPHRRRVTVSVVGE